jgi:uncharacterized LabA/DUF88 family protein
VHQGRRVADEICRVRVFIEHWEFSHSWVRAYSVFTKQPLSPDDLKHAQLKTRHLKWQDLPEVVLDRLDDMEYIEDIDKDLRNVDIYASERGTGDANADKDLSDFLEQLDLLPGFEVYKYKRKRSNDVQCGGCGTSLEKTEMEKGVKTKIACDLLSHAVKDLYDIAILFSHDAELVPSVLSVQEVFDKKVIHVGLKGEGQSLRSAAWGHILLNDLMRDLLSHEDFQKSGGSSRSKRNR